MPSILRYRLGLDATLNLAGQDLAGDPAGDPSA
jgi:hypothetical protein